MEQDRGQHGLTTKTQTACTHFSNRYWNDHSFEDTTKNCCERTEDRNGKNEHIFTLLMLCSWLQSVSVSRSEVEEEGWESAELPRHTCRNFILVRTTKLSLLSLPGKSREPLEERLREPREREERMESVREPRVMGVAPMSGMGGMAVGYPSGWLQEEGWMIPATRTRACGPEEHQQEGIHPARSGQAKFVTRMCGLTTAVWEAPNVLSNFGNSAISAKRLTYPLQWSTKPRPWYYYQYPLGIMLIKFR